MKQIPLSQTGKHKGKFFALVDDEDYEWLILWRWSVRQCPKTSYAMRTENKKTVHLHRVIMNVTDAAIQVDHEDHNGLNCQKTNLRTATRGQNGANKQPYGTSKYLGVHWNVIKWTYKGKKRTTSGTSCGWSATISNNKKTKNLGRFKSEEEAAMAYDKAAKEAYGEFANLNFK